jgi:universal stress protein A
MSAYQHLLLALDFSPEQPQLVARAQELAKLYQARLTLLHVVEYMGPAYAGDMPLPDDFEIDKMLMEKAMEQLDEMATGLQLPDVTAKVELGVPKHEITRVAKELAADLIVVGSHGRHGLQLLLGSTANGVLHLAHCDVLAVRVRAEQ